MGVSGQTFREHQACVIARVSRLRSDSWFKELIERRGDAGRRLGHSDFKETGQAGVPRLAPPSRRTEARADFHRRLFSRLGLGEDPIVRATRLDAGVFPDPSPENAAPPPALRTR
jgi:hypothetical protein